MNSSILAIRIIESWHQCSNQSTKVDSTIFTCITLFKLQHKAISNRTYDTALICKNKTAQCEHSHSVDVLHIYQAAPYSLTHTFTLFILQLIYTRTVCEQALTNTNTSEDARVTLYYTIAQLGIATQEPNQLYMCLSVYVVQIDTA